MGTVLLVLLLKALEDGSQPGDVQGLAYSALGKLARRLPAAFHDRFDILERFFTAACHPDALLRSHVVEALAMMRAAYANPSPTGQWRRGVFFEEEESRRKQKGRAHIEIFF